MASRAWSLLRTLRRGRFAQAMAPCVGAALVASHLVRGTADARLDDASTCLQRTQGRVSAVRPVRYYHVERSDDSASRRGVTSRCCGGGSKAQATHGSHGSHGGDVGAGSAAQVSPAARAASGSKQWPLFTDEEVSQRDGGPESGGRVWITVGDAVYDVTDFVARHPGGAANILQAAGASADPFWVYWAQHHISAGMGELLQGMRVGTLADSSDVGDAKGELADFFATDDVSERPDRQTVLTRYPWQTQTVPWAMVDSVLTPNSAFYVRNHSVAPSLGPSAAKDLELTLSSTAAVGDKCPRSPTYSISVADLEKTHPLVTVTSVMQCCGNRGGEMLQANPQTQFSDPDFADIGVGMMGNAQWTGVRLVDVLATVFPWLAKLTPSARSRLHVQFTGFDDYVSSTPLDRVWDRDFDVLLATRMNGEPLPKHHGAPLRVVLPGLGGARCVKWLTKIEILDDESPACWNRAFYKDSTRGSRPSIQELPMQSLILSVCDKQVVSWERDTVADDLDTELRRLPIAGVAWGGGRGRPITGVEVSADGGSTWMPATMLHGEVPSDDSSPGRAWSWVRWTGRVPVPRKRAAPGAELELVVRATDDGGGVQPLSVGLAPGIDTGGAYLYNGWHRVRLRWSDARKMR